jgi:hypothetical protein
MGRFAGLVADLQRCAEVGRVAFEDVSGAGADVTAADLAVLTGALALADRAVQAASVVALAQFARREEVPDPQDVAAVVEKVHGVGFVEEFASTEVAATLGVSTRTADSRLEQACQLSSRLPRLLAKVADGLVELGQVGRVLHETAEIDTLELVHTIDAYVADRVGTADPTRLGALARYAISRTCPQFLRARATKNRSDRTFDVCPGPAGMAEVYALIPAGHAAALWEAATELAKQYQGDNPELSLDQARADAFVDLALANVHVTANVTLGVPVLSTAGSDLGDNPNPEQPSKDAPATEADQAGAVEPKDEDAPAGQDDPAPGPSPDPAPTGAGAGRDLTSAAEAEEWDRRRDVDNDPWYARHTTNKTNNGAEGDAADPGAATGSQVPPSFTSAEAGECSRLASGATISGVHLPKVGYVPPDVVAALVSQLGTKIGLAILDANTGTLLHTVREAYRPDAGMRHFITIRDGRCRMFGCQLRAQHWDLDHAVPHPQGATTPTNLAGLCRRHHRAKQRRSWRYHLRPDGVAVWQSPTGTTRVTYPEHHLPPPPDQPPPEAEPEPVATKQRDDEPPPF